MQKKTFPDFVPPMMAQSAKEAFDSPDWIFEIKLDGYRAITDAAGKLHLWSRNGIPRFQLLQRFQKQPTAPTLYFVFDVLWSNGTDITGKTLLERRAVLETIVKPVAGIQLGNYVEGEGKALFELTKSKGME